MLYRLIEPDVRNAESPAKKRLRFHFSLRGMFASIFIVALLLGLVFSVRPLVMSRLLWGTGPVWFRPWPVELESLLDEMPKDARNEVTNIKAFCLGGLFEREYIWRFHLPNPGYQQMRNAIEMKNVAKPELSDEFWREWRWWNPNSAGRGDYMVPVDPELRFPFLLLMYDSEREILFGRNYAAD